MTAEEPGVLAHVDRDLTADRRAPNDESARRVVLVHGFTQTSRCWAPFDALLAAEWSLRSVDAPGHGASGHSSADLVEAAALLGATGGRSTYVGYSMGGRIVLRLALDQPAMVERLVLIGASPGLADADERAERRARDEALAARIERIGVPAFVDEWLDLPLFAGLAPQAAHREERRRNTVAGLAGSLRALGTGAQAPLWHRLADLTMPVLLLAGAADAKFSEIAHQMREHIGANATVALVPGAGHTAHLEQPERTASVVLEWLRAER